MQTRVKLLGGDADVDHTQVIGGNTVKLLGGMYFPIPPGFSTPVCVKFNVDSDKYGSMGIFWGKSGSTEQTLNPTLGRLIFEGKFFFVFYQYFKVYSK